MVPHPFCGTIPRLRPYIDHRTRRGISFPPVRTGSHRRRRWAMGAGRRTGRRHERDGGGQPQTVSGTAPTGSADKPSTLVGGQQRQGERMKRYLGVAAIALGATAFAFLSSPIGAQQSGQGGNTSETYRALNLFGEVFERVRADFVEKQTDEELIEHAINGMLTALDPHSGFMNAKTFRDMQVQTRGEFGGLGIEVTMEQGLVKVVSPIDDTPAARAGLKPNDMITHLNDEQIQGLTLNEAVDKMRGPIGSTIKLTIRRDGKEPFDVSIKRDKVVIQSVRSRVEGGNIGYIRITTFNEQTEVGIKRAIESIKKEV